MEDQVLMILMVMMMALEDSGMRFSSCANAKAALALRKEGTYPQLHVLALLPVGGKST